MEKRTFFISGHRDLTESEFETLYAPKIKEKIEEYDAYFIIGDYYGADIMAQNYLMDELNYSPDKVTVCHMIYAPMECNDKIKHLIGGFDNDIDRDSYMTMFSNEDIAFVRKGKEDSGTAQNIIRRYTFDNAIEYNLINLAKDRLLSCSNNEQKIFGVISVCGFLLFPLSMDDDIKISFKNLIQELFSIDIKKSFEYGKMIDFSEIFNLIGNDNVNEKIDNIIDWIFKNKCVGIINN